MSKKSLFDLDRSKKSQSKPKQKKIGKSLVIKPIVMKSSNKGPAKSVAVTTSSTLFFRPGKKVEVKKSHVVAKASPKSFSSSSSSAPAVVAAAAVAVVPRGKFVEHFGASNPSKMITYNGKYVTPDILDKMPYEDQMKFQEIVERTRPIVMERMMKEQEAFVAKETKRKELAAEQEEKKAAKKMKKEEEQSTKDEVMEPVESTPTSTKMTCIII